MSLPPELDFDRDREASPARMNRAMEYLFLRLAAATALQPEFESSIVQLQSVGLERLNEVLTPIFVTATDIAAQLDAIREAFLSGAPLQDLLDSLDAQVTARLGNIDTQLAANLVKVTNQLSAQDTAVSDKLGSLAATAKWPEATTAEARSAVGQRLLSPAVLYAAQVPVALADAATIALDLSTGINFAVTLTGNRTLANPTNIKPGQQGSIFVTQGGAAGFALSFGSAYVPDDLTSYPSLNPAIGAVTDLRYKVALDGKVRLYGGKPQIPGNIREQTLNLSGPYVGFYTASVTETVLVTIYGTASMTCSIALNGGGTSTDFSNSSTNIGPNQTRTVTIPAGNTMRISNDAQTYGWAHVRRVS